MRKSTAASKEENNTNASAGLNGRQQQQQQSGSYSSIVGSLQSQNGTETRTARGDNPFKYGKDEMMQVYSSMVANGDKVSHAPLDFERYDQVASSKPVQPASMNEPTEDEKALLAGNINSEQKPRRAEQTEVRQNGRRDNRQNGGARETKKHEYRKVADDQAHRGVQSPPNANGRVALETEDVSVAVDASNESAREVGQDAPRSQLSGRNTSRLATMGVFDTNSESNNGSKWKDEKDEDVLKEAMGYADAGNQEIEKLTDMYQNQSIGSANPQQTHQPRSYAEQYKPLSNGLPDLFPKSANPSAAFAQSQQGPPRGGFLESTPSPGLPVRQDPPMTRVMVMPDKLKWQYRDPTGQNQGPFSGLEMHDWYKAGFFQPNLLVKREEDEDFEPLSILVRRIGNQREPFLVPLPSRVTVTAPARSGSQDGKESWPNGQNWSGGGQPPFPQSFPSFGTTLTAEQQNALERRKQEEQYLMHRQREFLQQQQMAQQMAAQRLLHHQHPYGHNGQSFGYGMDRRGSPFSSGSERQGSMSSFDMGANGSAAGGSGWGGYAPQNQTAQRGPYTDFGAGIFDTPKSEVAEQTFREPERLAEIPRDDFTTSTQGQDQSSSAKYQKSKQTDYATRMAQQAQAMQLQAEAAKKEANNAKDKFDLTAPTVQTTQPLAVQETTTEQAFHAHESKPIKQTEIVSDKVEQGAPSDTEPSVPAYTVPWAAVSTKGRSLKEIQDIEAKRAAAQRQAERKAAIEVQAQAQAQADITASQAPSISIPQLNWANESASESPVTPGAAWKNSTTTPGKKTLAQIQEEEELARKARAASQARIASQSAAAQTSSTMGTRYADSAMKTAGPSWSTVGAGGRVSTPTTPRIAEQKLPSLVQAPAATKTRTPVNSIVPTVTKPVDPDAISPDFLNWARSALKGLNPGVNFAEFLQLLLSFGTDGGKDTREIISDSIYANSATLDGRRFADEFCKRRKEDLKNPHGQNKSISELTSTLASASASSNGWSDVVKTKPIKQDLEEEWNTSFKLQTKKGGKRK